MDLEKTALLNVDIQDPWATAAPGITEKIGSFTRAARPHMPVIWPCMYYYNLWEPVRAGSLHRIAGQFNQQSRGGPVLPLAPKDWIVCKDVASAFVDTGLDGLLEDLGIKRLLITGYKTSQCVYNTAIDAAKGYETILLQDLTSDHFDPPSEDALNDFKTHGIKIMDSSTLTL